MSPEVVGIGYVASGCATDEEAVVFRKKLWGGKQQQLRWTFTWGKLRKLFSSTYFHLLEYLRCFVISETVPVSHVRLLFDFILICPRSDKIPKVVSTLPNVYRVFFERKGNNRLKWAYKCVCVWVKVVLFFSFH